ncbi:MAG TPA: hypothetical protein VFE91_06025 [Nitrososphaerales archaeon]|nr:hypothetical protein [Nitrososphaerales archaeon]
MSVVMSEALQKRAVRHMSELIGQTMEEEIFSLNSLVPDLMEQLPAIFSESVINSVTSIMGDATGETLIRYIGEEKLRSPTKVYESLDTYLQGGAGVLKGAILEEFRVKIHKLFRMTVDLTPYRDSLAD